MRALFGRWSHRRRILVVGLVAALVVAVPVALASHDFTDVPDASPFHGDISAVKGAGITSGKTCVPPGTPPTYCPSESITREAMAAFVHRGFGRVGFSESVFDVPSTGEIDAAVVTIDVGGVAGQTQFVKLDATLASLIQSMDGCPCQTRWNIRQDGGGSSLNSFTANTFVAANGAGIDGAGATQVFAVPSGTTQTFRLVASNFAGTGTVSAHGALAAVTVPFGSTGASTLGSKQSSAKVPADSPFAR